MKFRKFSGNMLLDQSVWICKWVSWWCPSPHNCIHSFWIHRNDKNFSYFSYENVRLALITLWIRCRIMLTPIYLDMRDITIKSWGKNYNFQTFYVQNIWQVVRRWHHQLTHLRYSYGLVKKWPPDHHLIYAKLQNCAYTSAKLSSSRFSSGFHCFVQKILLFLLKLQLDQLRTSPLNPPKVVLNDMF